MSKRIVKYETVEIWALPDNKHRVTIYNNLKDLIVAMKKLVESRIEFDINIVTNYNPEDRWQYAKRQVIYYDAENNEYQDYEVRSIPKTAKRIRSIQRKLSKIMEQMP